MQPICRPISPRGIGCCLLPCSPDKRQIDGLGGAHPLTSKVGIVSKSTTQGVDLDILFAQLQPDRDTVDTTPNCGNMLAAVAPFALETGMMPVQLGTTTLRLLTLNTGMKCDVTVQTPNDGVGYEGSARIDGAPGTSAPIAINFLEIAGSLCAGLLPTGNVRDEVEVAGIAKLEITCIDNGMPLVLFRALDLSRTGYETAAELNQDAELKAKVESLRLKAGHLMGLGDVSRRNYPKMCLISAAPVRGIDPTTGHYYDDTKRYVEASTILSVADKRQVYEHNARRVYPRLPAALKANGIRNEH